METKTILLEDDDGNEVEHQLPAEWVVCFRCEGNGKVVDPGVDGDGFTMSEMNEDPDFKEDYFSGFYDIECPVCNGRTTVLDFAWDNFNEEQNKLYEQYEDQEKFKAECRAIREYERQVGA